MTASESRPATPPKQAFLGTGRRKSAIARVRLTHGAGKIVINKRPLEVYFTEEQDRNSVMKPFVVSGTTGQFDVHVRAAGGGHTGQAGAILLGVARALILANTEIEQKLRDAGLLTRDAREVERKKYGRRKARRRFQFSKR